MENGRRVIELIPSGPYPQNWIRIDLRLDAPLPSTTLPRLLITTSLEGDEPIDFFVNLEGLRQGHLSVLLKMLGQVKGLKLVFESLEDVRPRVTRVRITQMNRAVAMGSLIVDEVVQSVRHPRKRGVPMLQESLDHYRRSGSRGLLSFLRKRCLNGAVRVKDSYDLWIDNFGLVTPRLRSAMQTAIGTFARTPLISVLLPTYNTDERWLRRAIESVRTQIYPHWELCIADDCSTLPHVAAILDEYARLDSRIKVVHRSENGHISHASNSALALVTGEFTALLDHDDELTEDALFWVAKALQDSPSLDLIYSDEDKIDIHGRRFTPHFKMGWNVDLLYTLNLVTHLAVFRTALLREVGGFREGFEGSQDYDLVLRVFERTTEDRIRHIPRILYHWRAIPGSTAIGIESKSYAASASQRALTEHLGRRGVDAKVVSGYGSYLRVKYTLPEPLPKVSVIIGTRDRVSLLKGIVSGVLEKTDYPDLELIIIDNDSREAATLQYFDEVAKDARVRILKYPGPFNFAEMNNRAAAEARGSILALLNNDLLVIEPHWLKEMVSFAVRSEFGAVGARLLYPSGQVQHAGVILGIGGVAGHAHRGTPGAEGGYFSRSKLIQSFSAVTAACLVLRKEVFAEVGGFDARELAVAFNDVDLCLKIRARGYRVVYTPYAELYHLESASRGDDRHRKHRDRFEREINVMKSRWSELLANDPYYNPNLTLTTEDYSVAFPPRVPSLP
jgi:GT2 family glycosyltransferase